MATKYCRNCKKDTQHNSMLECLPCKKSIEEVKAEELEKLPIIDRVRRLENEISRLSFGM